MNETNTHPNAGGPVGAGDYIVRQGDCLESIALRSGHVWETIWNDPANSELKEARGNHNVLLPGDRLVIPKLRMKQEQCSSEQRHRFRRKGVPSKLRVRILQMDEPRANTPYRLIIDGERIKGETDDDGWIEVPIPPDAARGELTVGHDETDEQVFDLDLGGLDPVTEPAGVQERLDNLGYECESSGVWDDETRAALATFQKAHELEETGELDEQTREKLVEVHGS